jgi:site-specific DNA-methyltransferase (adenine-specific)
MFPPQIPHVFIRWLTDPGDIVYDPFSGRGTAPLEACRMGRVGLGSDANPLAYVLTAAKVDPPTGQEAQARLSELRHSCRGGSDQDVPAEIRILYSSRVLCQLTWLRDHLDIKRRDDQFIMALLLGVMHANYIPGHPARGLSISMPNTFSMSPGYVRRFIDENGLKPPDIDVFDLLEKKLDRMLLPEADVTRGRAWQQDACEPVPPALLREPAKLIFTSPPYLNVIKYGKYNWVRLWMLKQEPKEIDAKLMATGSISKYLQFVKKVLFALAPAVRDDGFVCLMIGDVRERGTGQTTNLAEHVWVETAEPLGWKLCGIVSDRVPIEHKVSRIWKNERGTATKTDRILVLSRRSIQSTALPTLEPIRWTEATAWA